MRASRGTELARVLPAHVAAAILGHSVEVAKDHYWQVTDADIQAALKIPAEASQAAADTHRDTQSKRPMADQTGSETTMATPKDGQKLENCGGLGESEDSPSGRYRTRTYDLNDVNVAL